MLFTNPLHETTRRVILPEEWENTADQVQVNYYSYLQRRLIPSTDVYIGSRLIYRSNSIGCRGDDLLPDKPVLAFFGDEFVHGALESNPIEAFKIEPFQTVNCGLESVSLKDVVARLIEVNEAAPISCAVIALPSHELAPVHPHLLFGPPCAETAWRAELDQLPAGVDVIFLLPPTLPKWPDQGLARRLVHFIEAYCAENGLRLLDGRGVQARSGFKDKVRRILERMAASLAGRPPMIEFLQTGLTDLSARAVESPPGAAQPEPAPAEPIDPEAHGPGDTGKNYPLW